MKIGAWGRDAIERVGWSTVQGACTGAITGFGTAVFTDASATTAFGIAVATTAGMAFFTSVKAVAASRLGNPDDAAIRAGDRALG